MAGVSNETVSAVLGAFGVDYSAAQVKPCRPGFSGALVWKVDCSYGAFALRRWPPEHPSPARLEWIHQVLRHVRGAGFALAPLPRYSREARSIFERDGYLWELASWMPGAAFPSLNDAPRRLQTACEAVAQFHIAARSLAGEGTWAKRSPGLAEREQLLRDLLGGGCARLEHAIEPGIWPEAAARGVELLGRFKLAAPAVEKLLRSSVTLAAPQYVCLRDIRAEHVLFEGSRVSGLIDFGAIGVETRAADIARFLGDAAGDEAAAWRNGIEEFDRVLRLTDAERRLIEAFDASAVLLSGIRWLTWIYLEKRTFSDRSAVIARLDRLLGRLNRLANLSGEC